MNEGYKPRDYFLECKDFEIYLEITKNDDDEDCDDNDDLMISENF
jgi:hypothetical protein